MSSSLNASINYEFADQSHLIDLSDSLTSHPTINITLSNHEMKAFEVEKKGKTIASSTITLGINILCLSDEKIINCNDYINIQYYHL